MTHLVKDLLISVLPPKEDDAGDATRLPWWMVGCTGITGHHLTLWFGPWWTCRELTILWPLGTSPTEDPASMALLLSNLRKQLKTALDEIDHEDHTKRSEEAAAQLRKALDEVEREEKTIGDKLRPRTLRQVEDLEAKLDQAKAELKRLKSELKP